MNERTCLLLFFFLGVIFSACQTSEGPSTDSESHFLEARTCSDGSQCASGLACICGTCTKSCDDPNVCERFGETAACEMDFDTLGRVCAGSEGGAAPEPVCLVGCSDTAECRAIDSELVCADGYCVPYPSCEALPDPPGSTVVNLGDQGLGPGDVIDTYFENFVQPDTAVVIPAGEYVWNGGGFSGKDLADASIRGNGQVVLNTGGGHEWTVRLSTSARFEMRNVTIQGIAGIAGSIESVATSTDASITLRNVNQPDGSVDGRRIGFYVPHEHAGEAYFIDCHVEGFADNGLYGSDPGEEGGAGGAVHVIRGLYRNNNIAGVRIGSDGSTIKGAVVIQDAIAPSADVANPDERNQRGIWIRQGGDGMLIRNVDVTQSVPGDGAFRINPRNESGTGRIVDVRVRNDDDGDAIRPRGGTWTGSDLDVTGSGETEVSGGEFEDVCIGTDCETPRTTQRPACP